MLVRASAYVSARVAFSPYPSSEILGKFLTLLVPQGSHLQNEEAVSHTVGSSWANHNSISMTLCLLHM